MPRSSKGGSSIAGHSGRSKRRKVDKENVSGTINWAVGKSSSVQYPQISDQIDPPSRSEELSVIQVISKLEVKVEHPRGDKSHPADGVDHSEKEASTEDSEGEGDETYRISEYERMRQRNIKANEEFFSQLGIGEAKENLRLSLDKPNAKPSQRGIKKEKSPPAPRRSSMRLRRLDPTGDPLPYVPEPLVQQDEHERPPAGPIGMEDYLCSGTEQFNDDRIREKIQTLLKTKLMQSPPVSDLPLNSFMKEFEKIQLCAERVAKVVPQRIFSVAVHPTVDKVIVAAGSKWGQVGLWDVEDVDDNQHGVVSYCPHSRPVNSMVFPTWQQDRLYSCSYDGTLRCAYFDKGIFQDVYSMPDEDGVLLRNFEFITPHTILVSQSDGCVALVDQRVNGTGAESVYRVHSRSMRSVSIHPEQKHYFITACVNGEVCLWDRRKLKDGFKKTNTSVDIFPHSKSVTSAYFSPITGNYILTTSIDDRIRIFDSSSMSSVKLKTAIRHNNYVGRWLTGFRATWHPEREDLFIVGSMEKPRQIEIYGVDGSMLKAFRDEESLGSVCSLNAIHPSRYILAGGNSSGRLHVFM